MMTITMTILAVLIAFVLGILFGFVLFMLMVLSEKP